MQPQVRNLQDLIAEQSKAITPQLGLIDESIQANDNSGVAQQKGLEAQQKKAFGQIEQGAQNKGMYFSGFSPDEQATYTSTTYLPALAALQGTIAKTRADLLGKKADLNTNVFDKASAMRENDLQTLAAWNKMTAEQQFNASEAEKQRAFDAQQNQLTRNAQAASSRASAGPSNKENFAATLAAAAGGDGKVSPGDYNALKNQWVSAGYGDYKSFHDNFWRFANDSHWWDYR